MGGEEDSGFFVVDGEMGRGGVYYDLGLKFTGGLLEEDLGSRRLVV